MKRFLTLSIVAVMALGAGSVAYANYCAFDNVPAATLLFPFVQLDYNNPVSGDTTIFAITNVSASAQIVHVTIWSDVSAAILDFNVVLSGYDVQTMNIRDILVYGDLPNTGTSAADASGPGYVKGHTHNFDYDFDAHVNPIDGDWQPLGPPEGGPRSELGRNEDPVDIDPSEGTWVFGHEDTTGGNNACYRGGIGYPDYPLIPEDTLDLLQYQLTYYQLLGEYGYNFHDKACDSASDWYGFYPIAVGSTESPTSWWTNYGLDQPTKMYVTADVVQVCNKDFPYQRSYWASDVRKFDNVLVGDAQWVNTDARFSEAMNAVHLEATPGWWEPGRYNPVSIHPASVGPHGPANWLSWNPIHDYSTPRTFYNQEYYYQWFFGGSAAGWSGGADRREPMPTAWALRYIGAGNPAIDTHIRAWKDRTDLWILFEDYNSSLEEFEGFLGFGAMDCGPYTVYAWDEDENFITEDEDPWSGGEQGGSYIKNLLPLEVQEVKVDEFRLPDENGWLMFIWPNSNSLIEPAADPSLYDIWPYQTWMGVKYSAFGQFSAFVEGAVLANWNCFFWERVPDLALNPYAYPRRYGYME